MLRVVLSVVMLLGLASPAWAVNESTTQMVLVSSPVFITRMQYLLDQEARVVLNEAGVGVFHSCRAVYAKNVVNSPASFAPVAAVMVVGGVNLIGTVTGSGATADSTASDAAILSQIATFFTTLAGCDTGS